MMLVLHGSAGSPYVARVRMVGYAKGLDIELRPAALGTPEFQRLNPLGKMPLLQDGDYTLPESQIIAEYLDDLHPTTPLMGDTPRERAQVRLVARTLDLYCNGLFLLLRAAAEPNFQIDADAERASLDKGLTSLDAFMAGEGYAAIGHLSLADCALVPWLYYGAKLTARGDDALTRHPKLKRYIDFIGGQELTQKVWGEMDVAFRAFMERWAAEQAAKAAAAG